MRDRKSNSGGVLLEFTLILPLLLGMFFGTFEFGRAMKAMQIVSVVSREAGNAALRNCSYVTDVNLCLDEQVTEQLTDFVNSRIPNTELLLHIYTYDGGTDTVSRTGSYSVLLDGSGTMTTGLTHHSMYPDTTLSRADFNANFAQSITDRNTTLAIAEVFHNYNPRVSPLVKYFGFSPVFYETTVY